MSKQSLLTSILSVFGGGIVGVIFASFFIGEKIGFLHFVRGYFYGISVGIIPSIIYILKNSD